MVVYLSKIVTGPDAFSIESIHAKLEDAKASWPEVSSWEQPKPDKWKSNVFADQTWIVIIEWPVL